MKLTNQFIYKTRDAIKRHCGTLFTKDVQGGINVYLQTGSIIIIYFKRQIYNHNINDKWLHYGDLEGLFSIIDIILQPKGQKPSNTVELSDKGVQAAINHIKNKVEIISKQKGNNAQAMILKTVAQELEQYL